MLNTLKQVFLPSFCAACQTESTDSVCKTCCLKILRITNIDPTHLSFGKYEGILKDLIHQFKFENRYGLSKTFSTFLIPLIPKNTDCFIPVPLHLQRLKSRKYNQMVLVLNEMSQKTKIPMHIDVLKKHVPTHPQQILSRTQRLKNLNNVFHVEKKEKIKNKNILLLDDVISTGTTTQKCKTQLLKSGANSVTILTIAKN